MNRRAFVFSLEALLTLLAAITLVLLVLPPTRNAETDWNSLQRNALAQDLLETSVKQKSLARELYAFADGDEDAKRALSERWTALLSKTGAVCFKLEAGSGSLETECAGTKRFAATASRALFDGFALREAKLALYFDS